MTDFTTNATIGKPINLVKAAISSMRPFDIDDALMRYSMADVDLVQRFELLRMLSEIDKPQAVAQSFPISNLSTVLRTSSDPFATRA